MDARRLRAGDAMIPGVTSRGATRGFTFGFAAAVGGALAALRAGAIAGAALDVYDEEPLPGGHPLRNAPRTVLTPHIGYVTREEYELQFTDIFDQIVAYGAGKPINCASAT